MSDELHDLTFDENEVILHIDKYEDDKLADMVIAYRYFGLYEGIALAAMQELAKRRSNGSVFEYEKYIDDNLKTLPKLDFDLNNLGGMLGKLGIKLK